MNVIGANDNVFCKSASDFTTESTELTETDQKDERLRIRMCNPLLPASVVFVPSVVKLRTAEGIR